MKYFIERHEATAYPNGTRFKHKKTGTEYVILKECGCGNWLHYEVNQVENPSRYGTIWQHLDIERLCEIVPSTEST